MNPFLYEVASLFYRQYGESVNTIAFVFPNRRAGLFFQKYISELAETPLFAPPVITLSDLMAELSGKQPADKINSLFLLYNLYVDISGSAETFDEFLYWGELLLNDFDDIDKYLVDARALFTNLSDLKEMDDSFAYLSDEQVQAVRTFWQTFYPKGDTPNQRQFLSVWEILYPLYCKFREALAKAGQGYEGMLFREAAERAERGEALELPYRKVVFIGLNALTLAEEKFLLRLQQQGTADFYWDYASPLVKDKNNRASFFMERNVRNFPSRHPLQTGGVPERQPEIEVIGVPSGVGQAKEVYALLSRLSPDELTATGALRTAVVLPDENLLVPVLNSIPHTIRHINVTMGYPLAGTPVSALMEYILNMQKNVRYVDGAPAFYFRDVLPILNHRYVMTADPEKIGALVKQIAAYNKVYVTFDELNRSALLGILFTPVADVDAFAEYLIRVLQELNRLMSERAAADGPDNAPQRARDLEQEFIFHYFATVNRMREVMREAGIRMQIDTYFRLLKRLTQTIKIPFHGEPLSGLQIMGILETRALDFDRVIILSTNEGVFPAKKTTNSFIPYNLRRGFGLPTYEHQDSIWAYHFYRLLYRAGRVSLLYDTRSNGVQTGEVSRYVYQLKYHYEVKVKDKLLVYRVSSSKVPAVFVDKADAVWRKLSGFCADGRRSLSASTINVYLDCPLKFYFSAVEGVEEEEEVTETVRNDVFGSILHKVLETVYSPLKDRLIMADVLDRIRKDGAYLNSLVEKAFAEIFFKTETVRPLRGQNFLVGEIIRKYVEKLLYWDARLAPFRYLESEKRLETSFALSDGRRVRLKGFIDRIDEVDGCIRIIDYKSGKGTNVFDSVENLFNKELKERAKAVMQVFTYAWMYGEPGHPLPVVPGIYYMRSLFSERFDSGVYLKTGVGKRAALSDYALYRDSFEQALRRCLDEIFDRETPFTQTKTEVACAYCAFRQLCGKG